MSVKDYSMYATGDGGITLAGGAIIDPELNDQILSLRDRCVETSFPGFLEVVPAFSSLTVYFDPIVVGIHFPEADSPYDYVRGWLESHWKKVLGYEKHVSGREIRVPVCYEEGFAMDLENLAEEKQMDPAEIIRLHLSQTYRVYMLGFLPGFPYMGQLDEKISAERKGEPVKTLAGSVGIAGRQTGIYTLTSPGGWQIIGRTPMRLFEQSAVDQPVIRPGDLVTFYSITADEFTDIKSGHT